MLLPRNIAQQLLERYLFSLDDWFKRNQSTLAFLQANCFVSMIIEEQQLLHASKQNLVSKDYSQIHNRSEKN
eukprot:1095369-Pleurochrysis_carterae.AAC.3